MKGTVMINDETLTALVSGGAYRARIELGHIEVKGVRANLTVDLDTRHGAKASLATSAAGIGLIEDCIVEATSVEGNWMVTTLIVDHWLVCRRTWAAMLHEAADNNRVAVAAAYNTARSLGRT